MKSRCFELGSRKTKGRCSTIRIMRFRSGNSLKSALGLKRRGRTIVMKLTSLARYVRPSIMKMKPWKPGYKKMITLSSKSMSQKNRRIVNSPWKSRSGRTDIRPLKKAKLNSLKISEISWSLKGKVWLIEKSEKLLLDSKTSVPVYKMKFVSADKSLRAETDRSMICDRKSKSMKFPTCNWRITKTWLEISKIK